MKESNKRNGVIHVSTCVSWPPPWMRVPATVPAEPDPASTTQTTPWQLAEPGNCDVSPPQTGRVSVGEAPAAASSPILAEHDAESPRLPPSFPGPSAVIVVADADGYTDKAMKGPPYMWCWIGGPQWFYLNDYPIPLVPRH